jgi:PAS domain S-box-containing protein
VGIAETDTAGRYLHANPPLLEILGYTLDELRELTWRQVTYPDDIPEGDRSVEEMVGGATTSNQQEKRYVRKEGTIAWVEVNSAPVRDEGGNVTHFVSVVKDVSQARDLKSQLAHAQRMDSIGRLAGGIAHDFNNLLTAILGHAEMGRAALSPDDPAYPDLREIEESALRATSLTRQLLTFARRQVVETRAVGLDELTRGAERLLRRLIGENIELVTAHGADDYLVQIDPGQFEQVIVNLAVNARDAMPDGGRLMISTRRRVVHLTSDANGQGAETECVELLVEDTGSGMRDEVCSRIFEPFFTTKAAGEGIGLGLATSYGIVRQAGGSISVTSKVGQGTTFTILLPIVAGSAREADEYESNVEDAGGGETILVVEDEESVRRLVVEVLRRQGYEVMQAEDGVQALDVLGGNADVLDLVVTDIVMPKMGGPEVASRVREMRPDIKVLFMSGYSADADRLEALAVAGTAFLAKPFTPTQLAAKVRALCDEVVA